MSSNRAKKQIEPSAPTTCRWKGCNMPRADGSWFCAAHNSPPAPERFPEWLRQLPYVIGTGLATSLLYDMLKIFFGVTHFHDDAANHVRGLMENLKSSSDSFAAINDVAAFVEATRDPGFAKDMAKALARSASEMA